MPTVNPAPRISNLKQVAAEHLVGDKIQPGHPLFGIVWINPARVSGAPCFFGTRVPVKTLFDVLATGDNNYNTYELHVLDNNGQEVAIHFLNADTQTGHGVA